MRAYNTKPIHGILLHGNDYDRLNLLCGQYDSAKRKNGDKNQTAHTSPALSLWTFFIFGMTMRAERCQERYMHHHIPMWLIVCGLLANLRTMRLPPASELDVPVLEFPGESTLWDGGVG